MISDRLLFVDTETGGLDPEKYSLLTVGLVAWDRESGIIDAKELSIKHDCYSITKSAERINKLSSINMNNTKPENPRTIIKEIDLFCCNNLGEDAATIAGHNVGFDVAFLKQFYKENHASFSKRFSHRTVDTHAILFYLWCLGKIENMESFSSAKAFKYFGIEVQDRHSALGDAIATAELFQHLIALLR